MPTRLALSWADRVSFVLTDGLLIKKLQLLDVVLQAQTDSKGAGADDNFDSDIAMLTGELMRLIPDLIEALGSEAPLVATAAAN